MLELRNISFGYKGKPLLYEGVSLSLERGERLALVAPSGFGKTTLCSIAAGYLKPSTGEVLVDGKPLPSKGKCLVQMIWQHPEQVLDPRMRMKDSLLEAGEIDEALLLDLGIKKEWLTRFPHELSGGELQRFCIARALATKPSYLIADEISTMLDALTQAQLWRFLVRRSEERNIGILLVSHSPALLEKIATQKLDLQSFTQS